MDRKTNDAPDSPPSISVVVPNFNHGHLIKRSIDGILSQKIPDLELIVIDDASTDDSVRIIRNLGRDCGQIRLIRNKENMGAIKTIQRGIEESKGEFICFVAADDCTAPGFFSDALERLRATPETDLYCGDVALYNGETGNYLGLRPPVIPRARAGLISPNDYLELLKSGDNHIMTGAAVFRRNAVVEAGGMDPLLGSFADGYLARQLALKKGFVYSPRINSRWHIFPSGVSMSTAIDVDKARKAIEIAQSKLESPTFPPWYARKYAAHLRFAMSRAALNQPEMVADIAIEIGLRSEFDRAVMRGLLKLPIRRVSRLLAIGWLWYRLKPYRIRDLIWTYIVRRFFIYAKIEIRDLNSD